MYTVIYKSGIACLFGYSVKYAYMIGEYFIDKAFDDFDEAIEYADEYFGRDSIVVPTDVLEKRLSLRK